MSDVFNTLKHWRFEINDQQVGLLTFDRADSSTNTFSKDVLMEFEEILNALANQHLKGLVIRSGKGNGFIAGADVTMVGDLKNEKHPATLVRQSQGLFDKLEALPYPTAAAINGFCMGGGTELSLACDYRIACNDPSTRIGLPEVLLGVHPGWGGTVRMPQLIGGLAAMDLMLSGRSLSASAAKRMGVVDAAVPLRQLERAAIQTVLKKPAKHKPSRFQRLTNNPLVRPLLAGQMRKQVAKRAKKQHYPAPYAIIDLWQTYGGSKTAGLYEEAESFARLCKTDASENLIRVFGLQEKLKSLAKHSDFKAKHVHVVGAGVMGGDIAAWCALKGLHVTLQDREPKFIAPAIKRAHDLFKKKLKKPRDIMNAMDRLQPDVQGYGAQKADVIIEAIFENLEAKQALFKHLEEVAKPDAILASNTSSIPLQDIAEDMKDSARLVGIHFFNPVAKMQLVEIVETEKTTAALSNKAAAFVGQISRLPLKVTSTPGFLVNRILTPYLMEAMQLVDEGYSITAIDKAAKEFGMPMGPIELADTVGLDICKHVGEMLSESLGFEGDSKRLKTLIDQGNLGKKSGQGFYTWEKGKPVAKDNSGMTSTTGLADRMVARYVNEAVQCLADGVVKDPELLDGAMIFGTGFAPFRGGPLNYMNTENKETYLARLEQLASMHGDRFKPGRGW